MSEIETKINWEINGRVIATNKIVCPEGQANRIYFRLDTADIEHMEPLIINPTDVVTVDITRNAL